jgi:nuclear pore complex protein Nup98-Nup96
LFDEQELRLASNISIDIRNRVSALGRKAALSNWFKEVVASTVEEELKSTNSPSSAAYTLLTGYQVEKACDTAADGGLIKLATLIAQAGSGDFATKQDLQEQLTIWREEKVNAHIDQSTLKIYELLAGLAEESHSPKLDWKRAFAICLWYTQPVSSTVAQVYEAYTERLREDPSTAPKPISPHSTSHALFDGLFSLIRLHADPATSLTQILTPLSFNSSPADYSIPWHLYILLSRCMRIRDMADRSEVRNRLTNGTSGHTSGSEDEDVVEGHSPSADMMTSAYAHQLESLGLIQEAAFVLLHIEGSLGQVYLTLPLYFSDLICFD